MTEKQLEERVSVVRANGYGSYRVTIRFRDRDYSCFSHNTLAYDRLTEHGYLDDRKETGGYTYKQALLAFYEECKRKHKQNELYV